jgi:RHS repeat-associated protein
MTGVSRLPAFGGRHSESACYLRPTSLPYGNTTSLPSNVTASWDDAGRTRNTNTPNGATAGVPGFNEYGYVGGLRVWKKITRNGSTFEHRVYVHAGPNLIAEYNAGAAVSSPAQEYVYADQIDSLVMIHRSNGQKLGVTRNRQWSVVGLHDLANGNVVERYAYDMTGKRTIYAANGTTVRTTSSFGNNFGYTNRWHDAESGLMYFRARYYNPLTGEFLRRDPLGFEDGMSLYRGYHPINSVDPMGLDITSGSTSGGLSYFYVAADGIFLDTPLGTVVYDPSEISEESARHIAQHFYDEGQEFGTLYLGNTSSADLRFMDTGLGKLIQFITQGKGGFQGEMQKNLDIGLQYRRNAGVLSPRDRWQANLKAYKNINDMPFVGGLNRIAFGELVEPGATEAGYKILIFEGTSTAVMTGLGVGITAAMVLKNGKKVVKTIDNVPVGAVSMIPGSYIDKVRTISMLAAPAGSKVNAAGYARNGPWFWRQMLDMYPDMFSETNKAFIRKSIAPEVDDTWIKSNPTHAAFNKDKLIHHHIDQGEIACGLPEKIHKGYHGPLHPKR